MNKPVDDPLKPLDQVLEPDIRSTWMASYDPETGIRKKTLADHHAEVARVTLNESVPLGVRQFFETQKIWFCIPGSSIAFTSPRNYLALAPWKWP